MKLGSYYLEYVHKYRSCFFFFFFFINIDLNENAEVSDERKGTLASWQSPLVSESCAGWLMVQGSPCEDLVENGDACWALDSSQRGFLGPSGTVPPGQSGIHVWSQQGATSYTVPVTVTLGISERNTHCRTSVFHVLPPVQWKWWYCLRKEKRKSQIWAQHLSN